MIEKRFPTGHLLFFHSNNVDAICYPLYGRLDPFLKYLELIYCMAQFNDKEDIAVVFSNCGCFANAVCRC